MVKYTITSRYHAHENFRDHVHNGIDFAMPEGTPLRAIVSGKIKTENYGEVNAGKTVFIEGDDGKTYIFGHLHDFAVRNGQRVNVGDLLGHSGHSGRSFGDHLHFGVKENGHFIDPEPFTPLVQKMDSLRQTVHSAPKPEPVETVEFGMNTLDIFNDAMQQFNETLSDMVLNVIHFSQLFSIHTMRQVLDSILFLLG
jgi:murein DD-endopeptidase MepM/ murein hydrolase activator NlpD